MHLYCNSLLLQVLIHIGDAPGHGLDTVPENMEDNYPAGDPGGVGDYKQLLRNLARLKIAYYFHHVNRSATAKMVAHFNSFFAKYQVQEVTLDAPIDLDAMLPQTASLPVGNGNGFY